METCTKFLRRSAMLFTLIFLFALPGWSQTTVLSESFDAGVLPAGWSQSYVVGTTNWIFNAVGGYLSVPATTHSGAYNARLYYGGYGAKTDLMTPYMDLSSFNSATLSFWHAQSTWAGDQDSLVVFYRATTGGAWSRLAIYQSSIGSWTQETLTLPNLSATYQINFRGCGYYGYGVCLDDVLLLGVSGPPPPPPPVTITVGTGTNTSQYPFLTFWMDGRTQLLYTAAQILAAGGSAGEISSMGFDVSSFSSQLMNGFNIRMLNTTATSLTGYASGMTTVYSGTYSVPGTGWQVLALQNNFVWDGVSNLLVEVCYDNSSYTSYSYVYGSPATGQQIYYYTDNAAGCSFTSAYTGSYLPNLRFVEQPWVGTLSGTVLNCFDNTPLAGVTVTCGTATTVTNSFGNYNIYNVVVGTYNVQFSKSNFVTKTDQAIITNGNTTTINTCLDPVPGIMAGTVTNASNGNPVVGAKIIANNPPYYSTTYSTAGGAYSLGVYPVGNFTVTASKVGFDLWTSAGAIAFVQGGTVAQDIPLLENTNPPSLFTATLNGTETAVDLTWGPPIGMYEIIYDDGIADNFTVWAVGGNENAVKFTPLGYPATIYGGQVNIGTIDDYPAGANPLVPFEVAVFDASGTGGLPGQPIDTATVTPSGYGWVDFSMPSPITVNSGSFYLVMIQGGNAPNAAGIAVDETAPQLRSYARFVTGSGPWVPASGNFMMRAIVSGTGGPLDLDIMEPPFINGQANLNATYQNPVQNVSGYQGVGTFQSFDWSKFAPNTPVIGNGVPGSTGAQPATDFGQAAGEFNGTTVELFPTDAVLFNNGPLVNSPGTGAGGADESVIQAPINSFGFNMNQGGPFYVADDFTVSGGTWAVTSMDFFGYQTGSTTASTFTGLYVCIWNGNPGVAGSTVIWGDMTTNVLAGNVWSNIYRVNAVNGGTSRPVMKLTANTPGLTLNPGTYWVEWAATGSLASGPWSPPVTINNTPITGNAIQSVTGVWTALDSPAGSGNFQGLPFIINGALSGGGTLNYQVWRLKQGEEATPGVWTNVGTTNQTFMTDPSWPSLACGPYRWAAEAIYPGNRFSPPAFSNVLGKCWTADVTINVGLTCAANPLEGSIVELRNNNYPDTVYNGVTDVAGQVIFNDVWKGNYTLTVIRFTYPVYTQVVDILGDMTIDVMMLQDKTPPTNLFVDDRSLDAIWNSPRLAVPIFTETWASGSFATNQWTVVGGNWQMATGLGNPAPSAEWYYYPTQNDYSQTLTSKQLSGVHAPIMFMKYDIYLSNFSTTNENQMAIEAWDGTTWTTLKTWTNMNGNINWTTDQVDLTAYTHINFKVRFRAFGTNSYDINNWNLDNIYIVATDGTTGPNPCVIGYNFYLNGVQDAFTTDTTYHIPASHVAYGLNYHACVNAVYGSGYSSDACYDFVSHYLYPPINLQAEAVECSAYLTWEKPQMVDAIDIAPFKGQIEHTPPDAGPAPKAINAAPGPNISSPLSGTLVFGSEALADVFVDFDIANVSGMTTIAPNTTADFVNGMVYLPNNTTWAYGVSYSGGMLYTVDHATGVVTNIGNMGSASFNDLAIDPNTSIIYGTSNDQLYTIDPSVPSYTLVGPHGSSSIMIGLACDGAGNLWGYDIGNDLLYSVDKTTGAATSVGSIGFNANYAQAMFYDNSTGLIMMAAYNLSNSMCEVRTVDLTTGNTTIVSSGSGVEITAATLPITGGGGGTPPGLIGYNIYRDGDFIWYIADPDILEYYDLNLDPDTYEYDVTAVYDLTDYGFPGMTDESLFEGPQFVDIMCGRPLPFYEPWDQGTFGYNDWTFSPTQGNWSVNTGIGNPAPTADFSWQPMITDYESSLESPILNAGPWNCAAIWLDFDYSLVDRNATGDEKLGVDLFYNGSWHSKAEYANDGSVAWTPQHIDISSVKGKAFKVRFRANGANSADILHWYVDNIHVYGVCNRPTDLTVEWTGPTETTLTWTAPVCGGGGGGTVVQYIFDDGTFENGWAINPGYLAWLGTEFPLASTVEGVIQSIDVWFGFAAATGAVLTVDFFDGTALTVNGSSSPFTAGSDDWVTVPVPDVPFIGDFRAMVKWDNLATGTNFLGLDEDGPYAAQDLEWYYDGTTWDKIWIAAGSGGPGVFGVRVTALVGGDLKQITLVPGAQPTGHITNTAALTNHKGYFDSKNYTKMGVKDSPADSSQIMGYNVYRSDDGGGFFKLNSAVVPATTYVDATVPATPSMTLDYFVTTVFNDSQANTFLCESPGSDTVSFITGVKDLNAGDLQIYPNPATEFVHVKSTSTITNIEVLNFLGQQVYTINGVDAKTAKVNVTSLRTGVYFVKVTTEQGIRTTKITVTR